MADKKLLAAFISGAISAGLIIKNKKNLRPIAVKTVKETITFSLSAKKAVDEMVSEAKEKQNQYYQNVRNKTLDLEEKISQHEKDQDTAKGEDTIAGC